MKIRAAFFIFFLIIILGAFLRLYHIEKLGTFLTDQAIELSSARQILEGKFTLIGIKTSNSELRNGAVMYYLLAPFLLLFNFNPVAGGILQTLLSLGTVALVFILSPTASILVAASPLLVIYSRQTLLAFYPLFFEVLALFLIYKITVKPSLLLSLALGILLGFTMQIHYAAATVFIFALIFPLFFLKKNFWKNFYLFFIVGFTLGFLPMIVFELRHKFFNLQMFFKYLQVPQNATTSTSVFSFWQETIAALLLGNNETVATVFIFLFSVLTIFLRKKLNILEKLCLIQILIVIIFTIIFRRDLRPPIILIAHYGLAAFVPLIILTVNYFRRFLNRPLLILVLFLFLFLNFPNYGFNNNHGYTMSDGWTLDGVKKTAEIIQKDNAGKNYNVIMFVDAQNQAYPLRYFLNFTDNPPLNIDNYSGADFLYVLVRPGLDLKTAHIWELNSFGEYQIRKTWEIQNGFRLFRLEKEKPDKQKNFLTLVYPVRGRDLWVNHELEQINLPSLPATFLLQYDALTDRNLVKKLKSCQICEFGIFSEVSEKLATDSLTPYILGDGHWSRPDKIFLSGYSLLRRQRMIDLEEKVFREAFGYFPKTVGAWYLDSFSLNYLVDKYKVSGYVSVADQYDTDAQRDWGKPWGTPFYPKKYNSLAEANSLKNKLNLVEIQWAQRHPTDGFCPGVPCSQNSLQANDYINNNKATDYFEKILTYYLNPNNPFNQITIGLEVGQELFNFESEHLKQLEILKTKNIEPVTVSQFTDWYKKNYPNLSPKMVITDGVTTWENTPHFRRGEQNGKIIDFRNYDQAAIFKDTFTIDKDKFLNREVVDKKTNIDVNFLIKKEIFLEKIKEVLSFFRFSIIDGQKIMGFKISPTTLIGFSGKKGFGSYEFPFQTLAQFQSLGH